MRLKKERSLFMSTYQPLKLSNFRSNQGFFHHYQELITHTVLPYQYKILNDEIEGVAKSHAIENFRLAGKVLRGEPIFDGFYGMVFQDSDVAKWLEAVAYSLVVFPDSSLEQLADSVIDLIEQAQEKDGYLNTYFTIKDKDKRFTNLQEAHELYCSGHMMEAAVAYYEATGKDKLLQVMKRNADHLYEHFMIKNPHGYSGHPEIELALLRLYEVTKEERYLTLCKHFIDIRGEEPNYFKEEVKKRTWQVWGMNAEDTDYMQCTKPVREQTVATGHSVRAVYLYTAMADLSFYVNDDDLRSACDTLWNNITKRQMYITGAIGSTVLGEAFTKDYHLPNDTVYGETCASIGLIFFAQKMLKLHKHSRYTDVLERALYNTVLAGMQLDGKKFFYVNPLEVIPGISGEVNTHRHVLPKRPEWYACACCPPNVARLLTSIGSYAYAEEGTTLYCHLYVAGEIKTNFGKVIECIGNYPYDGSITYQIKSRGTYTLAIRIPDWSNHTTITYNHKSVSLTEITKDGYAYLTFDYQEGDEIELNLDMSVHKVYTTTKVSNNSGLVALQRGPLVYCVEGIDNQNDILSLSISKDAEFLVQPYEENVLSGTVTLTFTGLRTEEVNTLYTYTKPKEHPFTITAIPYYTWGNRGISQMRVWLPEKC
jgi:DUF1680 family protein